MDTDEEIEAEDEYMPNTCSIIEEAMFKETVSKSPSNDNDFQMKIASLELFSSSLVENVNFDLGYKVYSKNRSVTYDIENCYCPLSKYRSRWRKTFITLL